MIDALPLDPSIIALAALVFFLGGIIKGALGFGLPLFAVPILALVMPLISAITMMGVPVLISNIYQAKLKQPIRPLVGRLASRPVSDHRRVDWCADFGDRQHGRTEARSRSAHFGEHYASDYPMDAQNSRR